MDSLQDTLKAMQAPEQTCPVCGEARTMTGAVLGRQYTVGRHCRCQREEEQALRAEEQRRDTERTLRERRRQCFSFSALQACTFANDDSEKSPVSQACRRYAEDFASMLKQNLGLLLYGPVGNGKTYMAAAIANSVINQGYPALMTTFAEAAQQLQGNFGGQHQVIERLARVPLLVLDDLGAERSSEYMMEQVYNIVDARYRARRPLIVTTNLPIDEIKSPPQLAYARIYDRILEMCHPVKLTGPSRRRAALKQQYGERNRLLGLEKTE